MAKFTLSKNERLKSEKVIASLFENGHSLNSYPLKLVYIYKEISRPDYHPLLFSISVPKRLIKKAHQRILVKRQIREAYRLNCLDLKEWCRSEGIQVSLMFLFLKNEIEDHEKLQRSMIKALDKLHQKLKEK